jgi:nucleoside-diphosphate-sugar epimerase
MLTHTTDDPVAPARVVVLGSRGFVGRATSDHLAALGIDVRKVPSIEIDLTEPESSTALPAILRADDAVVFVSALTPDKGRDIRTLMRNLAMAEHVAAAIALRPVAHLVYVGSDAVYADDANPVNEASAQSPSSYHGLMHFARERMLIETLKAAGVPLAILRPSLLYGPGDTHNGYGPNRFVRTALSEAKIALFGNGEEQRDHVFIADVAGIIGLALQHGSVGALNIATGTSTSFGDIAEQIVALSGGRARIDRAPRAPGAPIVHRHFDVTAMHRAFPRFRYTPIADGLAMSWRGAGVAANG